jgi:hypothetical protein
LSLAKVVFDVYASLLVGALVSNGTLNETKVLPALASMPLVEGRSFVADEFCECIQTKMAERPNNYWTEDVDSYYLKQFHIFAKNCARRQAMEHKIRHDQGIPLHTSVKIPMGGVPVDYRIQTMEGQSATTADGDGFWNDTEDGVVFDEGQIKDDDDWATDLVTGQEEQRKSS